MSRTGLVIVSLLAGVILVTGMVWGFGVAHRRVPRPFYLGKPLEYWFNQLPQTRIDGVGFAARVIQRDRETMRSPSGAIRTWGCWIETPQVCASAIRSIGTNALAFYLQKLRRDVGNREGQIALAARRVGYEDFLFRIRGVDSERGQAVTALILLKPLPPWVVSELLTLSTNRNRDIVAAAHCALTTKESALGSLHPPSKHSIDAELFTMPTPPDIE